MYIVTWNNSKGVKQERQIDKISALKNLVAFLVTILDPGTSIQVVNKQEDLK